MANIKGEPTSPTDWHALAFKDAAFWRREAELWEQLAILADDDHDKHHAVVARAAAAGCRDNARRREVASYRNSGDDR